MKPILGILAATMLGQIVSSGAEPEAREFAAKNGLVVKYRWSAPDKMEPEKS